MANRWKRFEMSSFSYGNLIMTDLFFSAICFFRLLSSDWIPFGQRLISRRPDWSTEVVLNFNRFKCMNVVKPSVCAFNCQKNWEAIRFPITWLADLSKVSNTEIRNLKRFRPKRITPRWFSRINSSLQLIKRTKLIPSSILVQDSGGGFS